MSVLSSYFFKTSKNVSFKIFYHVLHLSALCPTAAALRSEGLTLMLQKVVVRGSSGHYHSS